MSNLIFVDEDFLSHNCYAVRITYGVFDLFKGDAYQACVDFLKGESYRYFIVSECGSETNKLHCQAWLDLGDKKVATLRKHLREFTRPKSSHSSKTLFSCKQTDSYLPIKYVAYLTKEDSSPIHNLTKEEMEKVALRNAEYRKDQEAKILAKKNKRSARIIIYDTYYKDCKGNVDKRGCAITKRGILNTIVQWYVVNDKCIRDFQIQSDARYLWLKLLDGHLTQYCDHLYGRMDPTI